MPNSTMPNVLAKKVEKNYKSSILQNFLVIYLFKMDIQNQGLDGPQ